MDMCVYMRPKGQCLHAHVLYVTIDTTAGGERSFNTFIRYVKTDPVTYGINAEDKWKGLSLCILNIKRNREFTIHVKSSTETAAIGTLTTHVTYSKSL